MQVRAGGAAGHADLADLLPPVHPRTLMDPELGEMNVEGEQAAPVIDYHRVTGEEETAREHHSAAVRRAHRRTLGCSKIDPGVRTARLAVEKAAQPKGGA